MPIIYDTDMGNDIDDALALAMLHSFESRGEVDLLAVTITKDNRWSAPYVDAVNTFYGRGDIPIGIVRDGKTPEDSDMTRVPATLRTAGGAFVYPHDLTEESDVPGATEVLRKTLAAAADGSVTVIQVGFSTNLARLLDSPADAYSPLTGRALVAEKVQLLSVMGGQFVDPEFKEYNIETDIPSAQRLFQDWPTPIVASGFEVGIQILYPAFSIRRHFDYVSHHPVVTGYENLLEMPYDRPTWDLTSVLYAVRPHERYFDLSVPGTIHVRGDGSTRFHPERDGRHRILITDEVQRARILEALIYLSSEPPGSSQADQ